MLTQRSPGARSKCGRPSKNKITPLGNPNLRTRGDPVRRVCSPSTAPTGKKPKPHKKKQKKKKTKKKKRNKKKKKRQENQKMRPDSVIA